MAILGKSKVLTEEGIKVIEKKYNAKYLLDSALIFDNGTYRNEPSAFFYTKDAHPNGSNYFAISVDFFEKVFITDGKCIEDQVINGFLDKDTNEIVYSAYRHDCCKSKDGSIMIDGGRDYIRCGGIAPEYLKKITVKDGEIHVS